MLLRLFLLFAMLSPTLSFAATNLFKPVPGDKSLVVLGAIFGGLGTFSAGGDPLGEGIKLFNGAVLTIGGLLVAYTIVIGTIGTAHDGEMLGKKFSSAWVPIRTALGTALVLPVINGTYCTMQAIVGWLIVQGVGLADDVWSGYTSTEGLKGITSAGLQNISAQAFGYAVFQSQACVAGVNKVIDQVVADGNGSVLPGSGSLKATTPKTTETLASGATTTIINFGIFDGDDSLVNCGTATIPKTPATDDYTRESSTGLATVLGIGKADAQARAKSITTQQHAAALTMVDTMKTLAESFVNGGSIDMAGINSAISTYQKAVSDASFNEIKALKNFEKFGENASSDGWFLAGAFYTKLSFMTDLIQRSMGALGSATGPQKMNFTLLNDSLAPYVTQMEKAFGGGSNTGGGFGIVNESGTEKSWARILADFDFNSAMKKMFNINKFMVQDGEHPLMAMKRLGNTILSSVSVIMAAAALAVWKIGILSSSLSLFITISSLGLLMPLLTVGMTLSYVLPLMPFFLWLGAVIGWVVMCIEAILAAPMWAVMHLSPKGDDLVGTGSQGYRLVLSLMLRPVLMIFGLITSFVLIGVIGGLFNAIFFDVFVVSQQDSSFIIWIIGWIISPILYSIAMFILIKKLFNMIYVIPDEMLNWFGGGGPQLGNFANTIGGEAGGMAAGAAMLSNSAANAGNALAQNGRQLKAGADESKNMLKQSGASEDAMKAFKGQSVLSQAKFGKTLADAQKTAPDPAQLMDKFNELSASNNGASPEENLQAAQEHCMTQNYGPDAKDMIQKMTGGQYSGAAFQRLSNTLKAKHGQLMSRGATKGQADKAMKDVVKNSMAEFKDSPDKSSGALGNIMSKNFDAARIQQEKDSGELSFSGGENASIQDGGQETGQETPFPEQPAGPSFGDTTPPTTTQSTETE